MPSQEEINHQEELLANYRLTLAHYLQQESQLGKAHIPPGITHGIREARENIRRIKAILRAWNVAVGDHPDDNDPAPMPVPHPTSVSSQSQQTRLSSKTTLDARNQSHSRKLSNGNPILTNFIWPIIVTVIGGVILAYIIQDARFSPDPLTSENETTRTTTPRTLAITDTSASPIHTQTVVRDTAVSLSPTSSPPPTALVSSNATDQSKSPWTALIRLEPAICVKPAPHVLPGTIDPERDPRAAIQQITQAQNNHSIETWPQAPDDDGFHVIVRLTHIGSSREWIRLSNTFTVAAQVQQKPAQVQVIAQPSGQCGGGDIRTVAPLDLKIGVESYTEQITFAMADYFSLQPGEFEEFDLRFRCQAPGYLYTIVFSLPYTYAGQSSTLTWANPVELVCPQSYTVWNLVPGGGAFGVVDDYVWQDRTYVRR